MKRILAPLMIVAGSALAGFALFVLLMQSSLLRDGAILFYRGLVLGALAAVLATLALLTWRRGIDTALAIAMLTTSISFNLAFLIVLPVTIDRSISVFLLGRIEAEQTVRPLDTAGLRDAFVDDYVVGMAQIERRIDEQHRSGNIVVRDGRLCLTPRGHRFMRMARTLSRVFGTDPRFVGTAPPTAGCKVR